MPVSKDLDRIGDDLEELFANPLEEAPSDIQDLANRAFDAARLTRELEEDIERLKGQVEKLETELTNLKED